MKTIVYGMTGAEGLCGGIATANKNALRAMNQLCVDAGRSLVVISLAEGNDKRPAWLDPKFKFHGCNGSKWRFAKYVLYYAAAERSLFIFDHVTLALPCLPFAALRWCQTVIIAHGSEADDRMKRSSRHSFRYATLVLTNSQLTLRRLQRHLPHVRAHACLLGLSPDFSMRESVPCANGRAIELEACDGSRQRIGSQMLLLVARMDATEMEKGHEAVIRALPQLRKTFPGVQAVFPGPGSGRQILSDMAQRLGVADAVFFPGFVTGELLESLYCKCFAFVMPSQQEGFGLVYLEAMNFGKPCIGCRNDGAEEIIRDGETGFLLNDQSNVSELVTTLERLLSDPPRSYELGKNGFDRLRDHFSAQHHQNRFKQAIESLIE